MILFGSTGIASLDTSKNPPPKKGKVGVAYTPTRVPVSFVYAVADIGDIIPSHLLEGNRLVENAAFRMAGGVQPRDRGRLGSYAFIIEQAKNLIPDFLLESADVDSGAPVIGPNQTIEAGNGRWLILNTAYELGKGGIYKRELVSRAKQYAEAQQRIAAGEMFPMLDISKDLVVAIRVFSRLKDERTDLQDYLDQLALFGRELTPEQEELLKVFWAFSRSSRKVGDFLSKYLDLAEGHGSPKQMGFLSKPISKLETIREAARKVEEAGVDPTASLFAAPASPAPPPGPVPIPPVPMVPAPPPLPPTAPVTHEYQVGERVRVIKPDDRRYGWTGTVIKIGPEPNILKVALDQDVARGTVTGRIGTSFFPRSLQPAPEAPMPTLPAPPIPTPITPVAEVGGPRKPRRKKEPVAIATATPEMAPVAALPSEIWSEAKPETWPSRKPDKAIEEARQGGTQAYFVEGPRGGYRGVVMLSDMDTFLQVHPTLRLKPIFK